MQEQALTPDSRPLIEFPTGELVYKKGAAEFLGISLKTLDRYVKAGTLRHWKNEINGRIYYDKQDLLKLLGSRLPQTREVVVYCRAAGIPDQGSAGVSSRTRLQAQVDRVLGYCTAAGIRVDRVIGDIGKAGNLTGRSGVDKIFDLVLRKQISMVVVETPDRLARFAGAEILERFLTWHGVELHVIQKGLYTEEYRDELKDDLTHLILESRALIEGAQTSPL
jgi:predicted site-specific integrase-resolvase